MALGGGGCIPHCAPQITAKMPLSDCFVQETFLPLLCHPTGDSNVEQISPQFQKCILEQEIFFGFTPTPPSTPLRPVGALFFCNFCNIWVRYCTILAAKKKDSSTIQNLTYTRQTGSIWVWNCDNTVAQWSWGYDGLPLTAVIFFSGLFAKDNPTHAGRNGNVQW